MNNHRIVIEPGAQDNFYWRDLWKFRELFFFLAWRDILVRYKQTFIGVSWSFIRPFFTIIIFTLIGRLGHFPDEGAPYALLVGAAILPWQFFSNAFSEASNSLISNSGMLSKIYFPRLIIPASTIIVCLIDFLIAFVIVVLLMFWYHYVPSWQIVTLPLFLILALITSMGAGILIAAINVKYRDFRYVIPFIVQFGLYVSPVMFSSSVVPGKWKMLYSLNPMVGVIEGFRWAILGDKTNIYLPGFSLSIILSIAILIFGIKYFKKVEKNFADII